MQKLSFILLITVGFVINACWKSQEPRPDDPLSFMSLSAKKMESSVDITITALVHKGTIGPQSTSFEEAEIYISEETPNTMKLSYTTKATTLKLTNLEADKIYYLAAKGTKNGQKTELSEPIMISTRSLKSLETITENTCSPNTKSSVDSPYWAYSLSCGLSSTSNNDEIWVENRLTKTKKMIHKNSSSKHYFVKGFYNEGKIIILETTQNKERAFDYYDIATEKFVNIEIPADARVWNYAFSPDGTKLAYTGYNKQGLYIYDTKTKEDKLFSTDYFYDFDWSRDGKTIVQLRNKPNVSSDIKELIKYKLSTEGQKTEQLLEWNDLGIQWLSLSPKEEYILFASYVANSNDLWIYEIKTGKVWQISNVNNFGWLSDKEFFANINKAANESTWKTVKYRMP